MKLLSNIKLVKDINCFYKKFYEGAYTKLHVKDLQNRDWLAEVQYDINETLNAYEDCFYEEAYEVSHFLNGINERIATLLEAPRHKFHWEIAVPTVALILVVVFTIYQGAIADKLKTTEVSEVHTRYTAYGRYYTDGIVITNDGNEWSYSTDTVSNKTPYNNMPVWIGFDDNGTPNDITDDVILGLVYDRETAIYDKLETALSDKFELERKDNNIRIQTIKKSVE